MAKRAILGRWRGAYQRVLMSRDNRRCRCREPSHSRSRRRKPNQKLWMQRLLPIATLSADSRARLWFSLLDASGSHASDSKDSEIDVVYSAIGARGQVATAGGNSQGKNLMAANAFQKRRSSSTPVCPPRPPPSVSPRLSFSFWLCNPVASPKLLSSSSFLVVPPPLAPPC